MRLAICLGFARVKNTQGPYLLIPSYSAPMGYEPGYLLPPGGPLALHADGKNYLSSSCGVPGLIDASPYRFRFPDESYEAVLQWFRSRRGRATSIDSLVLAQLFERNGHITSSRFAGFVVHSTKLPAAGSHSRHFPTDNRVTYLIEAHDITLELPPKQDTRRTCAASAAEIAAGRLTSRSGPNRKINDIVAHVMQATT